MIVYKELEAPSAVLSAWSSDSCSCHHEQCRGELPSAAEAAAASVPAPPSPPPLLLLHRADRITAASASPDSSLGLHLAHDWLLPFPAAAAAPLPGGRALIVSPDGIAAAVELPPRAGGDSGAARVLCQAALPGIGDAGGDLREPLAFGGFVRSLPLTLPAFGGLGGSGGGSGGGPQTTHVVVAGGHSVLHLLSWTPAPGGGSDEGGRLEAASFAAGPALLTGGLPDLRPATVATASLAAVAATAAVHAVELLPASEQALAPLGGGLLAAVLHGLRGPGHAGVDLACVELDAARGAVLRGPWSLRDLHPTARLLHRLPPVLGGASGSGSSSSSGGDVSNGGLLVISSRGAGLLASTGAPSGPRRVDVARWRLDGLPVAVAAVGGSGRRLVIADDAGTLTLLDLSSPLPPRDGDRGSALWGSIRIATTGPTSVPSALALLPLDRSAGGAGLEGLLVVASASGSSQTLGVLPPGSPPGGAEGGGRPWPLLQSALLPSLAPASCVAAVPGGSGGLPEAQVLVGCGRGPRGRIARVRSGVGLRPFVLDGPELEVRHERP